MKNEYVYPWNQELESQVVMELSKEEFLKETKTISKSERKEDPSIEQLERILKSGFSFNDKVSVIENTIEILKKVREIHSTSGIPSLV